MHLPQVSRTVLDRICALELYGSDMGLEGARLVYRKGEPEECEKDIKIDGFFLAIGHHPNSEVFSKYVKVDEQGYIITEGASTHDGRKKFLKDGFTFTYGQAQKWVNMTLKYLWLLDMLPNGLSEAELHVPVDSFILEALKETQQFNTEENKITGSGESYYYNGEAWSAISEYKNYKNLQEGIRNIAEKQGISPIQWEGSAWMDVAKKRSSK